MTKRASILLAALKLLALKGVHATPMSAIAKEAGTGMGTIYNYFPNKEALINALYVKIKNEEKAVFTVFNDRLPIRAQFDEYYIKGIQYYLENPLAFHFVEQLQASPMITAESKEVGYAAIVSVLELIEEGKKEGVIKGLDTKELLEFIGGTVIAYLRLYFQGNRGEDPVVSNQLRMVWDAIKQ